MGLLSDLERIWADSDQPFLLYKGEEIRFSQVVEESALDLSAVKAGDVVALIGDFNPLSIITLLKLVELGTIVVPLTVETQAQHEYFFEAAQVDVIVQDGVVRRREHTGSHVLIDGLRAEGKAGLVLFTTGTTGKPKAILHDFSAFIARFSTPRPSLRTINFLLFDHIGGINTLFHTLFNKGVVIAPTERSVDTVLSLCEIHGVEVLPSTPTFLRMMLISGAVPDRVPPCLNIITYGTERMDQPTLDQLCELLPSVDFRQTFGMSELGIVRVKSKARNSLFMKVGGAGVQTKVVDGVLHIHSETRMLGYLNAESPFDEQGWYNTKDIVELDDEGFMRVTGRVGELINVGGLKFMASEVEKVALLFEGVGLVKAIAKPNPITGQHVELSVQPADAATVLDKAAITAFLKQHLQAHMVPKRVKIEAVGVGHRFKRS